MTESEVAIRELLWRRIAEGLPRRCRWCQIEFTVENCFAWADWPRVLCCNCRNCYLKSQAEGNP